MLRLLPIVVVLALVGGAQVGASVAAQSSAVGTDDVPTQAAAMQKVSFMLGRWAGSGWVITQSGRQDFNQTEKVHKKVEGTVVTVDGEGRDPADHTRVVDSALAVLTFNDVTGQYRWEAFSQGFITQAVPVVGDHSFQWSIQAPSTTIRYTLTFTATAWHEIGEVSLDGGTTWRQNFQMDLHRVR